MASDGLLGDVVAQTFRPARGFMIRKSLFALAIIALATAPALAEIDLSGSWQAINHEDALERDDGECEE